MEVLWESTSMVYATPKKTQTDGEADENGKRTPSPFFERLALTRSGTWATSIHRSVVSNGDNKSRVQIQGDAFLIGRFTLELQLPDRHLAEGSEEAFRLACGSYVATVYTYSENALSLKATCFCGEPLTCVDRTRLKNPRTIPSATSFIYTHGGTGGFAFTAKFLPFFSGEASSNVQLQADSATSIRCVHHMCTTLW